MDNNRFRILTRKYTWLLQRTQSDFESILSLTSKEVPIYYYNKVGKAFNQLPQTEPIGVADSLDISYSDSYPDPDYFNTGIYANIKFFESDDVKKKLLNNEFGSMLNSVTISSPINSFSKEKILYVVFGPKELFRC